MKTSKFLFVQILILLPFTILAQDQIKFPEKEGKVIYEDVLATPGIKKTVLFSNAKKWFADFFKNANAVIQSQDNENGQIIGKGILRTNNKIKVNLSIQIDCKDDKYRYRVYDLVWSDEDLADSPYKNLFTDIPFEETNYDLTNSKKNNSQKKYAQKMIISLNSVIMELSENIKKEMIKNNDF